jgi:dTDP-4-amino-4,6-dideoxygalactose transaminase
MSEAFIPFHKPFITDDEVNEVSDAIRSGWWTTGPKTILFEKEFNSFVGSKYSVVTSSWTSAAHLALEAIGLQEGDEVIVPSITFTATAEIACYFKATPVIVDVQKDSFNINPAAIEKAITPKTKAIIPVHYGGNPCDMDEIKEIAGNHNIKIIEDAAHALPSYYKGRLIGTIGDVTCFSFYVTKTLATGEGGMICTDDKEIAERCSIMRLHGINKDSWNRYTSEGSWYYEVVAPGYKYNFTDIQASLGLAQLKKINVMHKKRERIYKMYNELLGKNELINLYKIKNDRSSSYHLYPILLDTERLKISRSQFIDELKNKGIGASVHFIPLYRHPFYKETFKLNHNNYPVSEFIYNRIVTLPIWPGMTDDQVSKVADSVNLLTAKNCN